MARALIVIDLQNDFCPGGALAVAGGDEIVQPINGMMADYDTVILTQDWHPADHSSFAENHPGAEAFSVIDMPYGLQVLWPAHCVIASEGAGFHRDLNLSPASLIIRKGFRSNIDSYSAFFENDHKTPTGLAGSLREQGIDDLTFAGLALDFCVAWSAIDARKLGFTVSVVETAARAIDLDGSLNNAQNAMREAGVELR